MKNYVVEVKEGHHVVRMLSDREIEAVHRIVEFLRNTFESIQAAVYEIWNSIDDWFNALPAETKEALLNEHTTI